MQCAPFSPRTRGKLEAMCRRAMRTALVAGLLVLSACAGSGPAADPPTGTFDRLQADIFNQNCLSAGCHNSQSQAGAMDLSPGASYDALVNVVPLNTVAEAKGMLRVDPFAPGNSFLIRKLRGPGPGEGTSMPQGMSSLPESDIAAIASWILEGSPRGGTAVPTASPTPVPPTPTLTATTTQTLPPVDTATPTRTVTGTAPPTLTPTPSPSASPSPSPSPTAAGPTIADLQTRIFSQSCLDAFCHNSVDRAGNLVLEEGQSYSNLVGVTPDNAMARTNGLLRVDPGNVDNSFIVLKLAGPPNPRFGSRMPLGKLPLSAEEMQLVRDWIANGAPQ